VSVLNVIGFIVELSVGVAFGSLALVSDAFHMLFDMTAYGTAFAAAYIADTRGSGTRWSYGLHRLEPIAAFVNGALLIPLVGYIGYSAYTRLLAPVEIATVPTLAAAFAGLLINAGSVYVLHNGDMSLNERGAFYHLLADAGGSIAVIVSVLVVELTGVLVVDTGASLLLCVLILWSAVTLLRESGAVLLNATSTEIEQIEEQILDSADHITSVDDIHIWDVCSQLNIATVHVSVNPDAEAGREATDTVHRVLTEHGIDHATVETNLTTHSADRLRSHDH
jgi:cation diffusion facilitator family transporter